MRISGFSFARNAVKLEYPLRESLLSVLPIVDELIVVLTPGDQDDDTRGLVESIGDPRIRIIDGSWDDSRKNYIYADLTNLALDSCVGDWCFYIQADEVIHEVDLPVIRDRCEALKDDARVAGLLFDYLHFFGDYEHVQTGHGWYQREVRIIRNGLGIRSIRDAQSFRFPGDKRITVAPAGARVFHYGWARHPRVMQAKARSSALRYGTVEEVTARLGEGDEFDYGPLDRLERYRGSHPSVMHDRRAAMDWADLLRMTDPPGLRRTFIHKDERRLNRMLTKVARVTGIDLNHTNHGRVLRV